MTERLKGAWVSFDQDYRDDDAENILLAIRMIRGVAKVEPNVTNISDYDARAKIQDKFRDDISTLYKNLCK